MVMAPRFEVDPLWPKPLPNHWVTGSTIGVSVDAQDRVWTIHRPNTVEDNFRAADLKVGECCKVAPPVLVYDQAGNLVNSWGGPGAGYDWPDSNHGITVDYKGNVWIGGNGTKDTQILKFAGDGKFLMQLGKHGVHNGSNDTENFWQPTRVFVDASTNEAYISDGYGNRRIIVFDADTGKYKRHWGAYGNKPTDEKEPPYDPAAAEDTTVARNETTLKNFSTPHCVIVAKDGLVYVCDRVNDRIQVFHKDGSFVKEVFVEPKTLRSGSVWDMAFSRDPQQTYIYVANGVNEKINVLNRSTLEVLTSFGDGGRGAGQFFGAHNLATDSKGNLYVTETYTGARVQRFLFKGVGLVARNQGVVRPASR
jgi:DNA-binding beta-propeller fold protein YncE